MSVPVQRILLAGLASGSADRWTYAMPQLLEQHFAADERKLFKIYREMWRRTGSPLTGQSIRMLLADVKDETTRLTMLALVDDLEKMENAADEATWRFSVHHVQDQLQSAQFQDIVTTALQIHATGATVKNRRLEGRYAAVEYLMAALPELNPAANLHLQDAAAEADGVLEEYERAKAGKQKLVRTGIASLDKEISGLEPGDFMAVLGFTGEGKTMLCGSIAHNVVVGGGHVVYCTTETVPEKIKRRFYCKHSMQPIFRRPIPYNDMKHGRLSPEGEQTLRDVVVDLKQGRANNTYGAFKVTTIQTLEDVRRAIVGSQRELGRVDLVVIDYLALAAKSSDRVALVDAIKACKQMATSLGTPVVSPWQTSIDAWQRALKAGGYTKAAMSETSEIEKTADFVLTMLRDPDSMRLLCKMTKCRDEADNQPFELDFVPNHSYVGDSRASRQAQIRL